MPELPDLEIFKTNIFNRLTSKQLVGFDIFNSKKVHTSQITPLEELYNQVLIGINRVGKELFFDFGEHKLISVHLMLSGEMSIINKTDMEAIKYKIFSLNFEKESLVFSDKGGLCTIKYMPIVDKTPDAFDKTFTLEYFLDIAHKKPRMNVKAFLIDQCIVKGIGNAYADEIFWAAHISPHSLIGKIPDDILSVLYTTINSVLRDAIESIKSISPDIISGEERSFLKVHIKDKKETITGYSIIVEKIASKTTYFTEEQILYI
jgi:formamidopyrimidine-DNA glycosylase